MRNIRPIFLTILIFVNPILYGQQKNSKLDFEIIFGGYFHGDSIDLKLNSVTLAENKKLNSEVTGVTNFKVTQNTKALFIRHGNSEKRFLRMSTYPQLTLEILLNNVWYSYKFDIRKGKILHVQYYTPNGSIKKVFSVEQSNDYPLFL